MKQRRWSQFLKEKGFDVKYLKAECKCNLDGTYLIWEM
jgi:rhodanese-related sulfurtransferase